MRPEREIQELQRPVVKIEDSEQESEKYDFQRPEVKTGASKAGRDVYKTLERRAEVKVCGALEAK